MLVKHFQFAVIIQELLYLYLSVTTASFPFIYPRIELAEIKSTSDPLLLTPYLKNNSIALAQKLSRVTVTEEIGIESHAGFFTVNETVNSNLYFWYFPPLSKKHDAPVVLWLQGGPGGSSLFGLFTELGPLMATKLGFAIRKYHWALNHHLIFIDNPVGTGFSFTNDNGYCTDENCVAKGLYSCMNQFFTLFPNLKTNEFYIAGESYAGKYIPSLAMEIHKQKQSKTRTINLKGLAIGNGYCDPVNQMDYGSYLYEHGLLDDKQLTIFLTMQAKIIEQIKKEDWLNADLIMDKLIDGDLHKSSYYKSFTGFNNYYNFLKADYKVDVDELRKLLNNEKVRTSIHVGGLPFNSGVEVQEHLALDILKSVAPLISELLSHYRIMFYNGQLDIIVAYPLTESFLRNLKFNSAKEYMTAKRYIWRVGNDIAGYYKKAGNLTEVLVRNAGHMVPSDQPAWAWDLITRFIKNKI